MPTFRQKKLAENIILAVQNGKTPTKGELVESSGYSKVSATHHPHIMMNQKGVKEALKEFGFDPDTAKRVVGDILLNGKKERDKLSAADMIFKVDGSYAPEKSVNLNVDFDMSDYADLLAITEGRKQGIRDLITSPDPRTSEEGSPS